MSDDNDRLSDEQIADAFSALGLGGDSKEPAGTSITSALGIVTPSSAPDAHVIDPITGQPVSGDVSYDVVAPGTASSEVVRDDAAWAAQILGKDGP